MTFESSALLRTRNQRSPLWAGPAPTPTSPPGRTPWAPGEGVWAAHYCTCGADFKGLLFFRKGELGPYCCFPGQSIGLPEI